MPLSTFLPPMRRHGDHAQVRRRTLPAALVVVVVLVGGLLWLEADRRHQADRALDGVVTQVTETVDAFWDAHLTMQRTVAFEVDPADPAAFGQSFLVTHVDFALLLDGGAVIQAMHPERVDLAVGDTMAGQFPHIDAVRDGADVGFWATDQAVTESGVVIAAAIPAHGDGVLTTAFDPTRTGLPEALEVVTDPLAGFGLQLVEPGTGVTVLDLGTTTPEAISRAATTADGWSVSLTAPPAGVAALVGGTTLPEGRLLVVVLVALVALAWWRLPEVLAARREVAALRRDAANLEASRQELRRVSQRVAHDLLNPLTALNGLTSVLLNTDIAPQQRDLVLRQIHSSSDGALQLVRSVLERAEQVGGEPAEEVALLDVHDFLLRVVGPDLAVTGGSVELDSDIETARVPPVALRTMLVNLVGNALKYAGDDQPPRVVIDATEDRGVLRLTVRDNGPGVAEADLERIFEPGIRLDAGSDVMGRGSGLAEVRRLAALSGGRVWASPNEPHGLAVHLAIPQARLDQVGGAEHRRVLTA